LSEADAAGLPLTRLDALEVVLRFEVGELSVSLGELRNLRPGHVFDLEQALNRSTVRILAHGNVLGKGSLVAVGERLGVRVSDFALGAL
jgi:type III secretion protein Q